VHLPQQRRQFVSRELAQHGQHSFTLGRVRLDDPNRSTDARTARLQAIRKAHGIASVTTKLKGEPYLRPSPPTPQERKTHQAHRRKHNDDSKTGEQVSDHGSGLEARVEIGTV
jgi:hypothetical protein